MLNIFLFSFYYVRLHCYSLVDGYRDIPESVYHAKDFNSALDLLGSDSLKESLDRVFVIGGSAIYQVANH